MSEKAFALVITVVIVLALALWVPCLEALRKTRTEKSTLATIVRRFFPGDGLR